MMTLSFDSVNASRRNDCAFHTVSFVRVVRCHKKSATEAHSFNVRIDQRLPSTKPSYIDMHPTVDNSSSIRNNEEPVFIINPPKREATWAGRHSPALRVSTMQNCNDVRAIYGECLSKRSSDKICKQAVSYFSLCVNGSHE
jgi:hypothetical protein